MSKQLANGFSNQPLGTSGDLRRRFLRHHVVLVTIVVIKVVALATVLRH